MNTSILFSAFLYWTGAALASGTTVGNGGNTIICKDSNENIKSIELLDFYEVRLNGQSLKLNSQLSDYKQVIIENLNRWQTVAPKRTELYKNWLSTFEAEAAFVKDIEIPSIPDTGAIAIPIGCELKPAAFQRENSQILPGVKRYVINKDYWDRMDSVQQAGLVMHELIYREGILAGHKTSFPTRYFNGYLAASDPNQTEYAYIVYRLPLTWAEVGKGISLRIGSYTPYNPGNPFESGGFNYNSKLSADGSFRGNIDIFSHFVETNFLSFLTGEELADPSNDYNSVFTNFDVGGQNFVVSLWRWKNIKNVVFKLKDCNIELKNVVSRNNLYLSFAFDRAGDLIFVSADGSGTIETNPENTWVRLHDGTLISSIKQILNEGQTLVTTSGEQWTFDVKKKTYIRVR